MQSVAQKSWTRKHPVLTVYVGGELPLEKLELPKGLTVVSVAEVAQRAREALKSTDKTVRGWLLNLQEQNKVPRDASFKKTLTRCGCEFRLENAIRPNQSQLIPIDF